MAAAIERRLRELMATPPPTDDTPEARDRRVLFAGIARGVIEHLKHPEAFEVVFWRPVEPHRLAVRGPRAGPRERRPMSEPVFLDVPFHLGRAGRTGATDADDHVRDLILQVLLTSPGERVNRPTSAAG